MRLFLRCNAEAGLEFNQGDKKMNNQSLWTLIHAAWRAIVPTYEPLFEQFAAEHGLTPRQVGWLFAALTFEPETITPNRLRVRNPYTAADIYLKELEAVAGAGFFVEAPQCEFSLIPSARAETLRLIADGRDLMAQADPLLPADSSRLAALLGRLARAALDAPLMPENWSIRLSYRLMPEAEPPLPYFEQAVSCLHAYRDDAHIAAWKPGGFDAPTLETLTLLWRGEADSLDAVCEKLRGRGYPPQVYAGALVELRKRGFLEGPDPGPRLTESGKSFREKIEQDTERTFFAAWSCLDEAEKAELAGLATRLRDGLIANGSSPSYQKTPGG
jgi:hypothetical protein